MSEYTERAEKFAEKHGIELIILDEEYRKYFPDDKQPRHVFEVELRRNGESYRFEFGQSIAAEGTEPTLYDILSCLTKSDPGDFEDFCSEYGYDEDSRKAEQIWKNVVDEFANVERLFGDILEELYEIQ